ncbi:MAG: hypothetical protein ACJA13_000367 [Paraglaciecola sp.]|jgi:hypothetical protein
MLSPLQVQARLFIVVVRMVCLAILRVANILASKVPLFPLAPYSLDKVNLTHNVAETFPATSTVLIWIYPPVLADGQTLSRRVYEKTPGFIVSSLAIWLVSTFARQPNFPITLMFEKTTRVLAEQP